MAAGERGTVLTLGRYTLLDALARGGMATVHLGRLAGPAGFARTVAIKRLHSHLARDPELVTSLLDEARLAARIQHPNVVAVLDIVAGEGELFIVMEYVQGESLVRLVRDAKELGRPIPLAIASALVGGALRGLHAAHEVKGDRGEPLNLVHRDFTPHNIMVRRDGTSLVVDFGVAKAAGRFHTTEEGKIKGKLPYMAPEQLRGGSISRLVDIWAAGSVLWETLTGSRLFAGTTEAEVLERLLFATIEPPSKRRPDVPEELDAVVLGALERDASRRFPTAEAMADALERAVRPALGSEVRAWLESLAGQRLEAQAKRLTQLESELGTPTSLDTADQLLSSLREGGSQSSVTSAKAAAAPPPSASAAGAAPAPPAAAPPTPPEASGPPLGPPPAADATTRMPQPARATEAGATGPAAPAEGPAAPASPAAPARPLGEDTAKLSATSADLRARRDRRGPLPLVVGALVLAGASGGIGFALSRGGPDEARTGRGAATAEATATAATPEASAAPSGTTAPGSTASDSTASGSTASGSPASGSTASSDGATGRPTTGDPSSGSPSAVASPASPGAPTDAPPAAGAPGAPPPGATGAPPPGSTGAPPAGPAQARPPTTGKPPGGKSLADCKRTDAAGRVTYDRECLK